MEKRIEKALTKQTIQVAKNKTQKGTYVLQELENAD